MLIEVFKSLSRRIGVYNAIRYSRIYYRILKYKNPGYIRALDEISPSIAKRWEILSVWYLMSVQTMATKRGPSGKWQKELSALNRTRLASRRCVRDMGTTRVFVWRISPWETGPELGRSS